MWALEGVRSLAIDLANAGDGPTFVLSGLGSQSVTRLTMINQRRYDWLAMAIGLIVLLVGLTKKTWPSRLPYLFFVILAAVLVPMLTGWIMELQSAQAAILSAVMASSFTTFSARFGNRLQHAFLNSRNATPRRATSLGPSPHYSC